VFVPGKKKGPKYHIDDDGVRYHPLWDSGVNEPFNEDAQPCGYCKKEDNYTEWGKRPSEEEFLDQCPAGQGSRCELLRCKEKIDNGDHYQTLQEDPETFAAFARHGAFLAAYQSYKRRRLQYSKPKVEVLYGPTSTNKTRRAFASFPDLDNIYVHGPMKKGWFDTYAGQPHVILDEFTGGDITFGMLNMLLDGYPQTQVPIKGSHVYWSPSFIIITSPVHPRMWYVNEPNHSIEELLRRFTSITECKKKRSDTLE